MTTEEAIAVLMANIDKTVKVTYKDGDIDLALVLTVDDEGFVFDLAALPVEERAAAYWTRFSDIAEVQPMPNSK